MRWTLGLWLAVNCAVFGQVSTPTAEAALNTSGAFFALSVSDVKASSEWYAEKLGMKIVMQVPKSKDTPGVVVLESPGLIVELLQRDNALSLRQAAPKMKDPEDIHGIFKVGVIVKDFDMTLATLKARSVEIAFGPYPKKPGQRANVIVKDNAGNLIQIFGK